MINQSQLNPISRAIACITARIVCKNSEHTYKGLYYMCSKQNEYRCRICRKYSARAKYVYTCWMCQHTFCARHAIQHFTANQVGAGNRLNCSIKRLFISATFPTNVSNKICRIFGMHFAKSELAVTLSIEARKINLKECLSRIVAFLEPGQIKKLSIFFSRFIKQHNY